MTSRSEVAGRAVAGVAALVLLAPSLGAQTDYYNTDRGRPVQIEDALAVERYAFEVQVAPLRLERERGGRYHWEVAPELAYGILPRTQLEVGFPLVWRDGAGHRTGGLAGIEVAALHSLNVETRTLPALAVAAEVLVPAGGMAPERVLTTVKGIATRTFPWARFHANAQYTLGRDAAEGEETGEASRWMAGVAVDRTFPIRSFLVIADVFAEQPLHDGEALAWTAEAGLRYQTSPVLNVDLGVGHRFTGSEPAWFFTFGASRAFAVRSLMPGR